MRPASAIVSGCLAAAGTAHAGHGTIHAVATGGVSATDNAFGGASDRQPDMLFQLRPGVLFTYDSRRMIDELNASLELLEYAVNHDQPTLTFFGGWTGLLLPGPRSEVTLSADAGTGKVFALAGQTSPDQGTVGVLPAGGIETRQGDGGETLSWQSTKETRISQTAFARWTATSDGAAMPTTTEALETGLGAGFEWTRRHDALGLEAGASFVRLETIAPPGATVSTSLQRQINPRASLIWRHDIDKHWSIDLDAGGVYIDPVGTDPYNPTTTHRAALLPVVHGLVAYTQPWGHATLALGRSVSPNQFIAENTVDDGAVAQVSLPLPWRGRSDLRRPVLVGLGTIGVDRTQLVDPDTSQLKGSFEVAHVDLGVAWTPELGRTLGVRYQLLFQHGDSVATMVTPSFFSNTLFFTFTLIYPGRVMVEVPRRTGSLRADRGDLTPLGGAEPVVPEAPSELGGP